MYKLIVSELAHQDLDKIVSYIAVKLANPTAASDFLDEVDMKILERSAFFVSSTAHKTI
jgi:plasmid stabilization system protein ParE